MMDGKGSPGGAGSWWWSAAAVLFVCLRLDLGASISDEGRALLRFKEKVELDPYGALSDWNEETAADPCFWYGVQCEGGRVISLDLKNLGLRGTLASELGKVTHLKSLILHNNSFSGFIPREIVGLQKLEVLDLGHNNFSNSLPSDFGGILSLKILILESNRFIDNMPPQLHELNFLSENQLNEDMLSSDRGTITRNYGDPNTRRILQVPSQDKGKRHRHKHRRNGVRAPSSHLTPFLAPVNAPASEPSPTASTPSTSTSSSSINHLHAPRSSPVFLIKPPSVAPVNKPNSLVKPPSASIALTSPSGSPPPTAVRETEARHAISVKIYIIVGVLSFCLVASALCVICWRAHTVVTIKPWATGLSGQLQKAFVTGVPALKRSEVQAACEDFSNIIGSLSGCVLYKGILSSGVEIAVISTVVKSAKDWSKQSEAHFRTKVTTLSKVNHKNFVNLLGYCEEEEPFTRMMVFEYAPNGTLFEHLHVKEAEHLEWATRLRIAMGIAYCLDHMSQINSPVILMSLDSSTIYLTDDYAAKVSDLEFLSVPKESKSSAEVSDTQSIVYRFGLLLLEIISGKLPFSEEDGLLEHWAAGYVNGERPLKELIDPTLVSFNEESARALCKVISSCIHPDLRERPRMQEIVNQLRDITSMPPEGAIPKVSPLWWAELEIISSEAN